MLNFNWPTTSCIISIETNWINEIFTILNERYFQSKIIAYNPYLTRGVLYSFVRASININAIGWIKSNRLLFTRQPSHVVAKLNTVEDVRYLLIFSVDYLYWINTNFCFLTNLLPLSEALYSSIFENKECAPSVISFSGLNINKMGKRW